MAVNDAQIDAAVPPAGTPSRALTNTALKDLIDDIAAKQDLDTDLTALAALATNGMLARTADATYALRSIAGTANEVDVANGDGVAGDPTISLPNTAVTQGSYTKANITVDSKGRITAASDGADPETIALSVRNASGATIAAGTPVYDAGFNVGQGLIEIGEADSASAATMPSIGIVMADIANNSNGTVVTFGVENNLDTSAFSNGDVLYVASGGGLTSTKPIGTALIQKVGVVLRSNASVGRILVELGAVNDLPNLADGNIWRGNASGVPVEFALTEVSGTNGQRSGFDATPQEVAFDDIRSVNVNMDGEVTGGTATAEFVPNYTGTINACTGKTDVGTIDLAIAINGVGVTGLGTVSLDSTLAGNRDAASGANTFASGDLITIAKSNAASSPTRVLAVLELTPTSLPAALT